MLGRDESAEAAAEAVAGGRGGLTMAQLEITQIKSEIGRLPEHRGTLRALGLKRIRHTVVHETTPSSAAWSAKSRTSSRCAR